MKTSYVPPTEEEEKWIISKSQEIVELDVPGLTARKHTEINELYGQIKEHFREMHNVQMKLQKIYEIAKEKGFDSLYSEAAKQYNACSVQKNDMPNHSHFNKYCFEDE